jgi:5-methylcytosine-specific restriction endonuclease McrA
LFLIKKNKWNLLFLSLFLARVTGGDTGRTHRNVTASRKNAEKIGKNTLLKSHHGIIYDMEPKVRPSGRNCMAPRNSRTETGRLDEIIAEARRGRDRRQIAYRDKALKIFPHICARCGREFAGKSLSDLTVHHKDHNHENNPQDGSNWELLCSNCHDKEHARYLEDETYENMAGEPQESSGYRPFANLEALLKK